MCWKYWNPPTYWHDSEEPVYCCVCISKFHFLLYFVFFALFTCMHGIISVIPTMGSHSWCQLISFQRTLIGHKSVSSCPIVASGKNADLVHRVFQDVVQEKIDSINHSSKYFMIGFLFFLILSILLGCHDDTPSF